MRMRPNIKLYQNIKKIIAVSVLLAIIVIVSNFTGFSKNIKNFFFLISSPIQKSFWQAGKNVSVYFAGILGVRILKKELDNLHLKNQELLSQIVTMIELKKENEVLREALGLGLEKEFQLMLAQIISKDISQDSILINKGKKDGVLEGWPVITGQKEKVLLGKIGQVYDRFSEVILISNKKSSFDAKISDTEIYGIVKGEGNFKLYLDLIPKDKAIFEGKDVIITSALGGVYPQGLLVGEIKTISKSDTDPFQRAEITPFFNIKDLDYLFIITEW
jgi:rod shape-determining protein MreC